MIRGTSVLLKSEHSEFGECRIIARIFIYFSDISTLKGYLSKVDIENKYRFAYQMKALIDASMNILYTIGSSNLPFIFTFPFFTHDLFKGTYHNCSSPHFIPKINRKTLEKSDKKM
jgi:hypothetical protein